MAPLPGSVVVSSTPTSNMAAPVDWSEFHVWNFRVQDLDKLKQKAENFKANVENDSKNSVLGYKAMSAATTSLVSVTNSAQHHIQKTLKDQWNAWRKNHATQKSPVEVQKGAVYTAYAQFASGAIGGCTATYITHWLDTVKVKMQTLPEVYSRAGPICCLKDTITDEGLRGLYKGAVPAVMGQTAKTAIVFMSYGLCEELVCSLSGHSQLHELTLVHHASAGAMTGIVASFVLCPLELVKCRLQALQQVSRHVHTAKKPLRQKFNINGSAPVSMVREIVSVEGVRGLYRGLPGIWVKEVPGSFIYFGSYEAARALFRHAAGDSQMHLNSRTVFLCGMFAGLCFCVTHPIESVKTRVQVMSAVSETRGFIGAMVHILRTEGMRPLCCGLKASAVRACLYSGIQFVTYEACRDVLLPDHF